MKRSLSHPQPPPKRSCPDGKGRTRAACRLFLECYRTFSSFCPEGVPLLGLLIASRLVEQPPSDCGPYWAFPSAGAVSGEDFLTIILDLEDFQLRATPACSQLPPYFLRIHRQTTGGVARPASKGQSVTDVKLNQGGFTTTLYIGKLQDLEGVADAMVETADKKHGLVKSDWKKLEEFVVHPEPSDESDSSESSRPDTVSGVSNFSEGHDEVVNGITAISPRQVKGIRFSPKREAVYKQLPVDLQPLLPALSSRHPKGLYSHQTDAIQALLRGEDVVVNTPTSSGKSLIFVLYALHLLRCEPQSTFILLFPTKALARDQLRRLQDWSDVGPIIPVCLDGDTPPSERLAAAQSANLVLTNADFLHYTILPQASGKSKLGAVWSRLLSHLRLLLVDEVHYYKEAFFANASFTIRRLLRMDVQILCLSATLVNASQVFSAITARQAVTVITADGSMSGTSATVLWETSNEVDDCVSLVETLCSQGLRVFLFTTSRHMVEVHRRALEAALGSRFVVLGYRGGYLPELRRAVEEAIIAGKAHVVVTTNALELGVDVGCLDCVVSVGFPRSLASLQQQFGRAGRGARPSIRVWVGRSYYPLEEALLSRTDTILSAASDLAPCPNLIKQCYLVYHLACWIHESGSTSLTLFVEGKDVSAEGPLWDFLGCPPISSLTEVLGSMYRLETGGVVLGCHTSDGAIRLFTWAPRWKTAAAGPRADEDKVTAYYASPPYDNILAQVREKRSISCHERVNFRAIYSANVIVRTPQGTVLETLPYLSCLMALYPGAIWLHEGLEYRALSLTQTEVVVRRPICHVEDVCGAVALTESSKWRDSWCFSYRTKCRDRAVYTTSAVLEEWLGRVRASLEEGVVNKEVFGFHAFAKKTNTIIDSNCFSQIYAATYHTEALKLRLPLCALSAASRLFDELPTQANDAYLAANLFLVGSKHALCHLIINTVRNRYCGEAVRCLCPSSEEWTGNKGRARKQEQPDRTVIVHDSGASGTCRSLYFESPQQLLRECHSTLMACNCSYCDEVDTDVQPDFGCRQCVLWDGCPEKNKIISRKGALKLVTCSLESPC
ncbi:MAG: uncharacterized protein KVP18_002092 [Porospora cf. gigantea A]|uniref:uncharacterized protein n=1 Tax=Porospora cf. gigantea A TaxID=2853593 RepID=UPI00355A0BE5|nr:MAG: hypothetical protein KVP18_002092 [Porospora cf. gigantea A]